MTWLMKNIILVGAIIMVSWNCSDESTTLVFENRSNVNVDSVVFSINDTNYHLIKIPARTHLSKKISVRPQNLNNHDVMILAKIYVNGIFFRGGDHYNDLSGALDNEYKLILKEDSTTKFSSEY